MILKHDFSETRIGDQLVLLITHLPMTIGKRVRRRRLEAYLYRQSLPWQLKYGCHIEQAMDNTNLCRGFLTAVDEQPPSA
jgi:hypothetical protein